MPSHSDACQSYGEDGKRSRGFGIRSWVAGKARLVKTMADSIMDDASKSAILIVDDEDDCRKLLSLSLGQAGYDCDVATSGAEALEKLQTGSYDLLLSDIKMPGMTGLELLATLRQFDEDTAVVMVTGLATFDTALTALKLGASDYVPKPFNLEHVTLCVERALDRRRLLMENRRYQQELEALVKERTAQLEKALEETQRANRDTVYVLSKAAETNDEDTGMHIKRVGVYTAKIASKLGINGAALEKLGYSSELHDVGKVATHPDILRKPGKLSEEEFSEMEKHTTRGAQILAEVGFLDLAEEIALCHHEKWDGSGYPRGMAGQDIPLVARITAIADVFDALTSKRCYRDALPVDKALTIIADERGKHFDPCVHDAFMGVLDDVLAMRSQLADA